jgi:hypothetical protein
MQIFTAPFLLVMVSPASFPKGKFTQRECRRLQMRLEGSSGEQFNLIFDYIIGNFSEYSQDQFGNYLCQKLYEMCSNNQKSKLLLQIESEIFAISENIYGTRVMQKIIILSNELTLKRYLAKTLQPHAVKMSMSQNSCHVIHKCLVSWEKEEIEFLFECIKDNCRQICINRWGCCLYQRCMDYMNSHNKLYLARAVIENVFELIQDPYGNYAIQYALDLEDSFLINSIIDRVLNERNSKEICEFCCHKFSSNVIEKCIRLSNRHQRSMLISIITECVDKLIEDPFGNYVLQTSLDFAEESQKDILYHLIDQKMHLIENMPHGKKLYSKIHREIRNDYSALMCLRSLSKFEV